MALTDGTARIDAQEDWRALASLRRRLQAGRPEAPATRALPLEFDESGFPRPQRPAGSFAERVRRLLSV